MDRCVRSTAPPRLRPVFLFTGGYMAAAAVGAAVTRNHEFVFYLVVMGVLVPAIFAIHRRHPLTAPLIWSFAVWGLLHMAGGLLPAPPVGVTEGRVLYSWWIVPGFLKYDQAVHVYGFGITTWLCWHLLGRALRSPDGSPVRPTPGILILCVAAGMGFGALNEVVEFAATLLFEETNVGGYENTGWDLVANLVGGVIAATLIRLKARPA